MPMSDAIDARFRIAPPPWRSISGSADRLGGLAGGGLVQVERHDLRALPAEQGRDGAPDSGSCPCNCCDFAAEIEQLLHALKYYTLSVKSTKYRGFCT